MSKLREAVDMLEGNSRLKSCHNWILNCDDYILDMEAKARNYRKLREWVEIYYENDCTALGTAIPYLFEKIRTLDHRHQCTIDGEFAHVEKRYREYKDKLAQQDQATATDE